MLQPMGYCILHAANGNEALTICEQWKGAIHLMVYRHDDTRHERHRPCRLCNRVLAEHQGSLHNGLCYGCCHASQDIEPPNPVHALYVRSTHQQGTGITFRPMKGVMALRVQDCVECTRLEWVVLRNFMGRRAPAVTVPMRSGCSECGRLGNGSRRVAATRLSDGRTALHKCGY